MIEKYFGGVLPESKVNEDPDNELIALAENTYNEFSKKMDELQLSSALVEIWKLVSRCNKYIDETSPWVLAKSEEDKKREQYSIQLKKWANELIPFLMIKPQIESLKNQIIAEYENNNINEAMKQYILGNISGAKEAFEKIVIYQSEESNSVELVNEIICGKEQFYINLFRSDNHTFGYNVTKGGDGIV